MKKILFIVPLLLIYGSIFTQNSKISSGKQTDQILPLSNEEFFENADFIFEGILVKDESVSYDAGGNLNRDDIYTSHVLKITEVYKGNSKLKNGTIELINKGGLLYVFNEEMGWEEMVQVTTPGLNIDNRYPAIFFCVYSDYPENKEIRNLDNPIKLKFLCDMKYASLQIGSIGWDIEYKDHIMGLNFLDFNSREGLYEYMKQFKGLVIPEKKNVYGKEGCSIEKLNEQKLQLEIFMLKQNEIAKIAERNLTNLNKDFKTNNNLTIEIQNQTVTGTGPFYFEFDIYASANNSLTYYSNSILRLDFNTNAFGTDLVANNKVVLTKGSPFNNSTYETNAYDVSSSQINLSLNAFQSEVTAWNRTQLTTTPKQLLHVKIELLLNLNNIPSNLSFANTSFTSIFSTYTTTANASWQDVINYDNTYYTNPSSYNITTVPPTPTITTNLSAIHLCAGIGDILTINGSNFGTQPGNVLFSSADLGGYCQVSQGYL